VNQQPDKDTSKKTISPSLILAIDIISWITWGIITALSLATIAAGLVWSSAGLIWAGGLLVPGLILGILMIHYTITRFLIEEFAPIGCLAAFFIPTLWLLPPPIRRLIQDVEPI
jgi:hypothetical protein